MNVAIIGAGPSGLAAAHELTKNGIKVDIYDNDKEIGGLAKCIDLWGEAIELGPHFLVLNMQEDVKELVNDILKDDIYHFDRLSRIYLNKKFYDYPPRPFNIIKNLGAIKTLAAITSKMSEIIFPTKNIGTVESYMKKNLGSYIYENFFKGYTEKLWGIPCHEIGEDYAESLIGFDRLTLFTIVNKMFSNKKFNLHRNCIYPKGGMRLIWTRLKDKIENQGGKIYLSTSIKNLLVKEKQIYGIAMANGEERFYDYIFSSISEASIIRMLPDVPKNILEELSKIQFRKIIFVYVQLDNNNFIEDNTIYLYDNRIKASRITNYNRFKNISGNNIVMCEYWTGSNEPMYTYTSDQMIEIAKQDLKLLPNSNNINIKDHKVIHLKNAYPVPDLKFTDRKKMVHEYLSQYKGLSTFGRANQKKLNFGMENTILDAINLSRHFKNHI